MTGRVGIGYDLHRLEEHPGGSIALAGYRFPCDLRVVAHSDGDVVLHACCDALLGAIAAGDLGEHFPDDDPRHAGRASREFLAEVLALPAFAPWRIVNVDVNVIAQRPRLAPHKPAMVASLAEVLGLARERVSIKARSNEGLDAIGRGEAIATQAAVLLAEA